MSRLEPHETLRRPVLTEKSTGGIDHLNAYVFEVAPGANKIQIKNAVERLFSVKVDKVNVRWKQGKWKRLGKTLGRTPRCKQAVVTLRPGDKIDVY